MPEPSTTTTTPTPTSSPNRIVWDKVGERDFQSGVDRGVLYVQDGNGAYLAGEGWNGLTKIGESPEGGDSEKKYANNQVYLNLQSAENFKGNIGAYTYPPSFAKCDGTDTLPDVPGLKVTAQERARFGLTYRTGHGNDTKGIGSSYDIHIVYNATASVSQRDYETINESPNAIEFSWDFDTIPVEIPGMKRPTAHLIINTAGLKEKTVKELEDTLYGGVNKPKLPSPAELIALLKKDATN